MDRHLRRSSPLVGTGVGAMLDRAVRVTCSRKRRGKGEEKVEKVGGGTKTTRTPSSTLLAA